MSTKTFFKRAALVVVASLGLGMLTGPTSQAGVASASLTLGAATATANVGDSATGSWTLRFTADTANGDTAVVKYSCEAPSGASCPAIQARQTSAADTFGTLVTLGSATNQNGRSPADPGAAPWISIDTVNGWGESATTAANTAVRSAVSFKAVQFSKVVLIPTPSSLLLTQRQDLAPRQLRFRAPLLLGLSQSQVQAQALPA